MGIQFCSLARYHAFHHTGAYRAYRKMGICYLDYWNGDRWVPLDVSQYHFTVAEFIQYELTMGL